MCTFSALLPSAAMAQNQFLRHRIIQLIIILSFQTIHNAARFVNIRNAGFENPSIASGDITWGIEDWTSYNVLTTYVGVRNFVNSTMSNQYHDNLPPEGIQQGWLSQAFHDKTEFGIYQTLAETISPNTNYSLKIWIGNAEGVSGLINNNGFGGYRIQLKANDIVLAEDDNSVTVPPYEWREITLNAQFNDTNPHIGKQLEIRVIHKSMGALRGIRTYAITFDDVRLTATKRPTNDPTYDPSYSPTSKPTSSPTNPPITFHPSRYPSNDAIILRVTMQAKESTAHSTQSQLHKQHSKPDQTVVDMVAIIRILFVLTAILCISIMVILVLFYRRKKRVSLATQVEDELFNENVHKSDNVEPVDVDSEEEECKDEDDESISVIANEKTKTGINARAVMCGSAKVTRRGREHKEQVCIDGQMEGGRDSLEENHNDKEMEGICVTIHNLTP
eukprot:66474_1